MRVTDDSGRELDAEVSVATRDGGIELVIESRGGGRNTEYIPALQLLLERLAARDAVLVRAEVASARVAQLPPHTGLLAPKNFDLPVRLRAVSDLRALRVALAAAGAAVAQAPGVTGGNPTKRLRLTLDLAPGADAGLMSPEAPVASATTDLPRIYASSVYGFDPETWGAFGFSHAAVRDELARRLRRQDRVLAIGTQGPETPPELRGRLISLLTLARQATPTEALVRPDHWLRHLEEYGGAPRWPYGMPIIAAETFDSPQPFRADVLPRLSAENLFMKLATNFIELSPEEAAAVLRFPRTPVASIYTSQAGSFAARILGSRPGPPPSRAPRILSPVSGPAATYCLEVVGPATRELCGAHLARRPGWGVFKVGFSNDPTRRRGEINAYFPNEAQAAWVERWTQWHEDEINAWAMEQEVFAELERRGADRIKGEIIVASADMVTAAWAHARVRARRPEGPVEVDPGHR